MSQRQSSTQNHEQDRISSLGKIENQDQKENDQLSEAKSANESKLNTVTKKSNEKESI